VALVGERRIEKAVAEDDLVPIEGGEYDFREMLGSVRRVEQEFRNGVHRAIGRLEQDGA
jgi:hypothetical protein